MIRPSRALSKGGKRIEGRLLVEQSQNDVRRKGYLPYCDPCVNIFITVVQYQDTYLKILIILNKFMTHSS